MALVEGPSGSTGSGGNGHKRPEIKLRIPEQVASGVYTNSMMVHHTPAEFVMDFALVTAGTGQVVARVITSPSHMKRILTALEDNVRKYESTHGPIAPPKTSD